MKTIRFSLLVFALLFMMARQANAQDAQEILKKMDEVLYAPKDMTSKIKIVLIDKSGRQKTREANMMQKGTEMRLFRFTAPASQAGIATLSLPHDVMYLYLPSYGKERRISTSVKSQKFAGTDFSYDDMEAKPLTEKYTPKLIRTEKDYYVLELIPKSPKSEYSKEVVQVDKTNFYPIHSDYYDKGGNKIKEADYQFEKIGKYWNTKLITMTDLRKNHKTKMMSTDVKYDTGLSDDEFTVRKLKQ